MAEVIIYKNIPNICICFVFAVLHGSYIEEKHFDEISRLLLIAKTALLLNYGNYLYTEFYCICEGFYVGE